jgi:hypothetical protein
MVNIQKILLTQKSNKGLLLELKGYPDEKLAVSRNYTGKILAILDNHTGNY